MTDKSEDGEKKYDKLVDDFYHDLKAYQSKTKELREEVESAKMEAKGWKTEARELRAALETITQYVNARVCSDSESGEHYKQAIVVGIDRMVNKSSPL